MTDALLTAIVGIGLFIGAAALVATVFEHGGEYLDSKLQQRRARKQRR
jgi:hypothetical protein